MSRETKSRRQPLIRPWAPEDDAVLLTMLEQGKQPGAIAVRLRRSISAIRTRKAALQHSAAAPQESAAAR